MKWDENEDISGKKLVQSPLRPAQTSHANLRTPVLNDTAAKCKFYSGFIGQLGKPHVKEFTITQVKNCEIHQYHF